jgi:hypothetical protein
MENKEQEVLYQQHTLRAELLNKELARLQQELKAPKDLGGNGTIRFKYRNCEQILELLKPLIKDKGLTIVVSDEMINMGDRYYVKAIARLSDGVVGINSVAWAREPESSPVMSVPQMSGAISSYARKYALCGLFAIDGGAEDPDSINMDGERDVPRQAKSPLINSLKTVKAKTEMITDMQKMDIQLLGGDYEEICRYFRTEELTKQQAIQVIQSLDKKKREKEAK